MKWNHDAVDDEAVDAAWTAFVDADAKIEAPRALEARVLAAVHVSSPARRSARHGALLAGLSLAATLVASMTWWSHWNRDPGVRPLSAHTPVLAERLALYERDLRPRPAAAWAASVARPEPQADQPLAQALPPMLMSLGAAPLHDTEPLQLARLRVPREALQALGVVLGPDTGALVDIDVLVGEDGLARDIRQVTTVQEGQP